MVFEQTYCKGGEEMKKWQFWLYLALLALFIVTAIVNWIDCNSFGTMVCVNGAFFMLVLMELAEIRNKIK